MPKFASLFTILMILAVMSVNLANADAFQIKGSWAKADPAANSYGGNYILTVPTGEIFYFSLQNTRIYDTYVGGTVIASVEGDLENYTVSRLTLAEGETASPASASNANEQALPKTGAGFYLVIGLVMTVMALRILYKRHNHMEEKQYHLRDFSKK